MHVAILQSSPACETPLAPVDLRLSDWPISLFNLLARSVTFGSDLPEPGLSPLIPYPICPGYDLTWADLGPAATASGRYTIPRSASHSPPIVVIAHDPGLSLHPPSTCNMQIIQIQNCQVWWLQFGFLLCRSCLTLVLCFLVLTEHLDQLDSRHCSLRHLQLRVMQHY